MSDEKTTDPNAAENPGTSGTQQGPPAGAAQQPPDETLKQRPRIATCKGFAQMDDGGWRVRFIDVADGTKEKILEGTGPCPYRVGEEYDLNRTVGQHLSAARAVEAKAAQAQKEG